MNECSWWRGSWESEVWQPQATICGPCFATQGNFSHETALPSGGELVPNLTLSFTFIWEGLFNVLIFSR